VWTGAVVPTAEGAKLITSDTSCTAPPIPAEGVEFRRWQYQGDLEDQTLDRTREGYVEIIEMADIIKDSPINATEKAVTHATVGGVWMPFDCSHVQDDGTYPTWTDWRINGGDLEPGTGGLFGSMTLVNPTAAQDVAFEATALDAFNFEDINWTPSGSIWPNLGDVEPKTSVVVDGKKVYITAWPLTSGADPVSAVMMNESVYNEYVLHTETLSKTDWVITFPTKSQYYVLDPTTGIRDVQKLFQRDFKAGGACDDLSIARFDREERRPTSTGDFSPRPPSGTNSLCWEANVVTFGAGAASLLNAKNRVNLGVAPYDAGWAKFTFIQPTGTNTWHTLVGGSTVYHDLVAGTQTTLSTVTYTGLPMIGFAAQQFNNGTLTDGAGRSVWASYVGRIAHRFSKKIN
jgi:hypothetical protein